MKSYWLCPRCHRSASGPGALSIKDNKTKICPECKVEEDFDNYLGREYLGESYWDTSLCEGAANSNGIYSLKSGWLKVPKKDDIPDNPDLEPDLSEWKRRANECKTVDDIESFIDDVYKLRQGSILEDGEYGRGNLIFKELRNGGVLQSLKDLKTELENKEMSLESLEEGYKDKRMEMSFREKMEQRRKKICERYKEILYSQMLPSTIENYKREHGTLPIVESVVGRVGYEFGRSHDQIESLINGGKY